MLTSPRPYRDYRDSGIKWLGSVPSHWRDFRIKSLFRESDERLGHREGQLLSLTRSRGLVPQSEASSRIASIEDLSKYKLCRPNDLVMNRMQAWSGMFAVSSKRGVVSPDYAVFRKSVEAKVIYFGFLFRTPSLVREFACLSKGIGTGFNRLYSDDFGRVRIAIPDISEQNVIVRFLKCVDRSVRRYVRAKEKLIRLLEEEKQAIINQAVTRGLDPSVRLKASGVEWLGDVPEHWEVRRLGHLATKFGSGITPRGGATVYQEAGVPFLRSQNVHFDGLRTQDVARIDLKLHANLSGSHVHPGDVLLNITGASIGRACSVPHDFGEANVNQHVCIIRTIKDLMLPGFLSSYLSIPMMQREIHFAQSGASREGLTLQSIRNFKVVTPPLGEQVQIVNYLAEITAKGGTAIERSLRQIDLVHEYGTRLVADVVTGKLDVREAAGLPGEGGDDLGDVDGLG